MPTLLDELNQQPLALRNLQSGLSASGENFLEALGPIPANPLITGMGASYHAAWIGALHLQSLGFPAIAAEAIDLIAYADALLRRSTDLLYISQSGESGEIAGVLNFLSKSAHLAALTNNLESTLGRSAQASFPLMAGEETLIASKTYLNSLALMWLIARKWAGVGSGSDLQTLDRLADQVEALLARRLALTGRLMDTFDVDRGVLFVGHGPAAGTARQAAMTLSEWAKVPARFAGIAAYRHGFIESIQPGQAVVVIAPPGRTQASALSLARELAGYGAAVLVLQNGGLSAPEEKLPVDEHLDEFLSPLLDIIPVQLYAQALVEARGITPGFRYISKVVQKI